MIMAQQRFHCELAFEDYLRTKGIPYIAVNETRKALLLAESHSGGYVQNSIKERVICKDMPPGNINLTQSRITADSANFDTKKSQNALKSFDYLVTSRALKLLIDIKGRKYNINPITTEKRGKSASTPGRLESWVTEEDVSSLSQWQSLFGSDFSAVFIFMYWCYHQPDDLHFTDIFSYQKKWYSMRMITVDNYKAVARPRSKRWCTVDIPTDLYKQISSPFTPDIFLKN